MKIGFISDIHLDHSPYDFDPKVFPEVDVWLNAGDTATDLELYKEFHSRFSGMKYLYVDGNHDFYNREIKDPYAYTTIGEVDGMLIAGATLWTDLSNPLDWLRYVNGIVDYRFMGRAGWNHELYMEHHKTHVKFLYNCGADVIVTHHAPSFKSVSKQYEHDALNICFATDLEIMILTMDKPPKYWFHGHMHQPARYTIGETTIICHPRGYPHENAGNYAPLIMEF